MTAEQTKIGNEIFERFMEESLPEHKELNLKCWSPTPWIVDVHTASREQEIRNWLRYNFGQESSPIHGRTGVWSQSSVTMFGYCWFGFKHKDLMDLFVSEFPSPPNPKGNSISNKINHEK